MLQPRPLQKLRWIRFRPEPQRRIGGQFDAQRSEVVIPRDSANFRMQPPIRATGSRKPLGSWKTSPPPAASPEGFPWTVLRPRPGQLQLALEGDLLGERGDAAFEAQGAHGHRNGHQLEARELRASGQSQPRRGCPLAAALALTEELGYSPRRARPPHMTPTIVGGQPTQ